MGSVDPDLHPSSSLKWSLKIGQKQRNFLFEELSGGVSLSKESEHLSLRFKKIMLFFFVTFFQIFVIKTRFRSGSEFALRLKKVWIWIRFHQNAWIWIETQ
jgi:predicted permease